MSLLALGIAHAGAEEAVVAYEIVDGRAIPNSLTGRPGDPDAGRRLYVDRQLTRCAGCHGTPGRPGQSGDGAGDAPPLDGVARRLSEGAVRLWLVAPDVLSPDTEMPAYYELGQRDDPADPRYGEPMLTATEIEDVLAYLMTLDSAP